MPGSLYDRLEPLLLQVSQPQRYAGVEMGAASRPDARLRCALVFPDLYEMGMAHTGFQLLYRLGNALDGVFLERAFAPWPDLGDRMRAEGIPLFTQETFSSVGEMPLVAFTLPTNLHATNLLYCLDLAGVPLLRTERGEEHPVVLAGGLGVSNPAPLTGFVDAFALGDGELLLPRVLELFRDRPALPRRGKLEALAAMEGFLVPGLTKGPARRVWLADLDDAPFDFDPILPAFPSAHHRLHAEVARGCARGCRFCEAGFWYRPWRERDAGAVRNFLLDRAPRSGFTEAGLLSLSTADYSAVEPLAEALAEGLREHRVSLSLPSLRIDAATLPLLERAREVRKSGLTFAPEAGASLRPALNKAITDDQILATVARAKALGWRTVKLYFMIGLPFEQEGHWEEIARLVERVRSVGMRSVTVHVANFVPKPWTPFQWAPAASAEHLEGARAFLRSRLPRRGVELKTADPAPSRVEAAVSRGDEATGAVLLEAYRRGCRFDNWTETFRADLWDALLPPARAFDPGEELPWERWVDSGLDRGFLLREWERAKAGQFSPPCTEQCLACGLGRKGEDLRFSEPLQVSSFEFRVSSPEAASCSVEEQLPNSATHMSRTADSDQPGQLALAEEGENSKLETRNSKLMDGGADNSQLATQNSQLMDGGADNSKLETQNSQLMDGGADNSQLATRNSQLMDGDADHSQLETRNSKLKYRYRLHLTKEGRARFLSTRHFVSFVTGGLLRAGVPLAWSAGFNPHPLVSTGPALPVGVASRDEVMEVWTQAAVAWPAVPFSAPGVRLLRAEEVEEKAPALSKALRGFRFREGGTEFILAPDASLRGRDLGRLVKLETVLA